MYVTLLSVLIVSMVMVTECGKFKRLEGVKMSGDNYLTSSTQSSDVYRCLMKCPEDNCMGINWNQQVKNMISKLAVRIPTLTDLL